MNSDFVFFIFIVPLAIAYLVISIVLDKRGFNSEKILTRGGIVLSIVVSVALKLITHFDGSGQEFTISETIVMALVLSLFSYLYSNLGNCNKKIQVISLTARSYPKLSIKELQVAFRNPELV